MSVVGSWDNCGLPGWVFNDSRLFGIKARTDSTGLWSGVVKGRLLIGAAPVCRLEGEPVTAALKAAAQSEVGGLSPRPFIRRGIARLSGDSGLKNFVQEAEGGVFRLRAGDKEREVAAIVFYVQRGVLDRRSDMP